jgi:hypothetical protein
MCSFPSGTKYLEGEGLINDITDQRDAENPPYGYISCVNSLELK